MRVLFVCHRVPFPPKRGGKIRPFNIIRHLHEQGHEVTVASLARSQAELDEAEGLGGALLTRVSSRSWTTESPGRAWWLGCRRRSPSSFGYFHSPRLQRRRIDRGASKTGSRRPDFRALLIRRAVRRRTSTAPVKILDFGDMDSQKWREYSQHKPFPLSAGYWLEAVKLERTERLLAGQFDLATCTTRAEMESLQALGVERPTDWFPNGVDAEFFQPSGTDLRTGPRHVRRAHGLLPKPAGCDAASAPTFCRNCSADGRAPDSRSLAPTRRRISAPRRSCRASRSPAPSRMCAPT